MCGIAGLLDPARATSGDELRAIAMTMADALQHRGPDDVGAWADPAAGVAFGHRRLAIIDVSSEGHQPMEDASGRQVRVSLPTLAGGDHPLLAQPLPTHRVLDLGRVRTDLGYRDLVPARKALARTARWLAGSWGRPQVLPRG